VAQLSPPFRIALAVMLGVVAVWFAVLRPKPVESPAPTAPGVTGLANDVEAAKNAADAANASAEAKEAATVESSQATASTAKTEARAAARAKAKEEQAALSGIAAGDRSKPLIRAMLDDKAVIVLFWNKRSAEDRAVRSEIARADRRDGRVVVRTVRVEDVGRYAAITQGAKVTESPTALVISPDRTAKPIVGYTTTGEVDQAVGDALAKR
jgi:hypothetical protein